MSKQVYPTQQINQTKLKYTKEKIKVSDKGKENANNPSAITLKTSTTSYHPSVFQPDSLVHMLGQSSNRLPSTLLN